MYDRAEALRRCHNPAGNEFQYKPSSLTESASFLHEANNTCIEDEAKQKAIWTQRFECRMRARDVTLSFTRYDEDNALISP